MKLYKYIINSCGIFVDEIANYLRGKLEIY